MLNRSSSASWISPALVSCEHSIKNNLHQDWSVTLWVFLDSSDAVFRYLLARWGVYPRDISGATGPVRIGDVL